MQEPSSLSLIRRLSYRDLDDEYKKRSVEENALTLEVGCQLKLSCPVNSVTVAYLNNSNY